MPSILSAVTIGQFVPTLTNPFMHWRRRNVAPSHPIPVVSANHIVTVYHTFCTGCCIGTMSDTMGTACPMTLMAIKPKERKRM